MQDDGLRLEYRSNRLAYEEQACDSNCICMIRQYAEGEEATHKAAETEESTQCLGERMVMQTKLR
jgi:hypothetical protein